MCTLFKKKWIKEEKNHFLISWLCTIVFLTIIFAASLLFGLVVLLTDVSLQKQEAMSSKNSHPWASRILSRIETFICDLRGCGEKSCVSGLGGVESLKERRREGSRDQMDNGDSQTQLSPVLHCTWDDSAWRFGRVLYAFRRQRRGQESFRYRILSKEMAGAHMESERSEDKTWWEAIGRQSQSSAIRTLA